MARLAKIIFCHLLLLPVLCLRPTPQIQTTVQAAVWSRKALLATKLSSNATPSLLAHLGSNRSRTLLEVDCPSLANAPAEQILNRLIAELEVSELIQSLGRGLYQTLPQLFETDFLIVFGEIPVSRANDENFSKKLLKDPPHATKSSFA